MQSSSRTLRIVTDASTYKACESKTDPVLQHADAPNEEQERKKGHLQQHTKQKTKQKDTLAPKLKSHC